MPGTARSRRQSRAPRRSSRGEAKGGAPTKTWPGERDRAGRGVVPMRARKIDVVADYMTDVVADYIDFSRRYPLRREPFCRRVPSRIPAYEGKGTAQVHGSSSADSHRRNGEIHSRPSRPHERLDVPIVYLALGRRTDPPRRATLVHVSPADALFDAGGVVLLSRTSQRRSPPRPRAARSASTDACRTLGRPPRGPARGEWGQRARLLLEAIHELHHTTASFATSRSASVARGKKKRP
jgi:hypothetical protein